MKNLSDLKKGIEIESVFMSPLYNKVNLIDKTTADKVFSKVLAKIKYTDGNEYEYNYCDLNVNNNTRIQDILSEDKLSHLFGAIIEKINDDNVKDFVYKLDIALLINYHKFSLKDNLCLNPLDFIKEKIYIVNNILMEDSFDFIHDFLINYH